MGHRLNIVALAAAAAVATPALLSAQQPEGSRFAQASPKSKQSPRNDPQYDIEELTPSQIQRAQEPERGVPSIPTNPLTSAPPTTFPPTTPPRAAAPKTPPQPQRAVACSGAFAKNSSHINLVTLYKSENVTFTAVEAPGGEKVMASVLFPRDPKRRLEVWWEDQEGRKGTHLIVIGGQSTWTAPKGLKLGMQLAAIEKLNGKPFKLKASGAENVVMISDLQGGALQQLPGGCRYGIYLQPDPKAPADARGEITEDKEMDSSDPILRMVKPTVSEILIGY